MSGTREELYLAALLEGIENVEKPTLSDEHLEILKKANEYASAGNHEKGNFDFVASPFENLKGTPKSNQLGFDFQTLNLSNAFFPNDKSKKTGSVNELWKSFKSDYNKYAQQVNSKLKAETTLSLLQKYAVTIPNPTTIHPEVSWYDYTKIKAGLAVCIHDYKSSQEENKSKNPLLIIRADISGIQDFISNIASKNASKNLKGRSFYVQLLVNTVLKLMLKKLNLFEGNVMYASGGNFFVIAPNTEEVRINFKAFEKEITAAIFKEHKTRIAVVMGYKEVSESQILTGQINEAIKSLFEEVIDKKKKQKFSVLMENGYDTFFKPSDKGGEVILDAITGEEVKADKNGKYWVVEEAEPQPVNFDGLKDDDDVITVKTAKQIFIGSQLRKADYWVLSEKQLPFSKKKRTEIFPLPNYNSPKLYHYLIKEKQLEKLNNFDDVIIYNINALEAEITPFFTLYGGNDVPRFEVRYKEEVFSKKENKNVSKTYEVGTAKDFNHLALNLLKDENGNIKVSQFKRLGVLKMDIDDLGSIFKEEVKRPNLTFSYYSALSRNLDWFFKGYLNTLWERSEFKHSTQIIYSGGDDLFIVGRWDAVTHFAALINKKFSEFTGANLLNPTESVTISGGISIVTDKFPIMKAADFASEAEHKAKGHELYDKDKLTNGFPEKVEDFIYRKNSFNFLGKSLHWEYEYETVLKLKDQFVTVVGDGKGKVPRSFLGKIQMHAANAAKYRKDKLKYDRELKRKKEGKPPLIAPTPRWVWTVVYDFSRMADRLKVNRKETPLSKKVNKLQNEVQESSKDFIQNLSKSIFTNTWNDKKIDMQSKYLFLELLGIAARWAELEIRSNQKK